jgi:DNA-binding transcriptional regulator YdaS (Cro superfamily)
MDLDNLIKRLGGGAAIARRLGLHRTAISQWKRAGLPDKVSVRAALLRMAEEAVMTAEERSATRDFLKGPLR